MSTDAISEAIQLLRGRREELRAEAARIGDEIARIDAAVAKLIPSEQPEARVVVDLMKQLEGAVSKAKEARGDASVRSHVLTLAKEAPRAWTSAEIAAEITRRDMPQKVTNLSAAVRTAIWNLEKKGDILRFGDSIVATEYSNDPALSGVVQASALTIERSRNGPSVAS